MKVEDNYKLIEDVECLQKALHLAQRFDGKPVKDDMALYRYMSKDHFLDIVENNRLTFAHISLWQDPFEGYLFKSGPQAASSREVYAGFYGQSWTFGKHEKSMRWSAFCPNADGVCIKTNVGTLRKAVAESLCCAGSCAYTLTGPIRYVKNSLVNRTDFDKKFLSSFLSTERRVAAKLLFWKRNYFSDEKEYRVLCNIGHAGLQELPKDAYSREKGLFRFPLKLDVTNFIEEIRIDPRMSEADVDRLKCRLVQADFPLKHVSQSKFYEWPKSAYNY